MKLQETLTLQALESSPERVPPRCRHFGPCGDCSLQHLSYPAQVRWKEQWLREILLREGGIAAPPPIETVPMENPWGHRSKMEFTFGQEGPQVILGLHRRASFQRIVNLLSCDVVSPSVGPLLETIREVAGRFPSGRTTRAPTKVSGDTPWCGSPAIRGGCC